MNVIRIGIIHLHALVAYRRTKLYLQHLELAPAIAHQASTWALARQGFQYAIPVLFLNAILVDFPFQILSQFARNVAPALNLILRPEVASTPQKDPSSVYNTLYRWPSMS